MASDVLPEDYGVNALSDEAIRRGTSYGKLVASLKPGEYDVILENYKKRRRHNRQKFCSDKIHTRKNGGHR